MIHTHASTADPYLDAAILALGAAILFWFMACICGPFGQK